MEIQDPAVAEAVKESGESTLEKAKAKAKASFEQLMNVSLDIAVTGKTGSGKSSFVNALRNLTDDDEGAAPTGVTETTKEPDMYEHPGMPNVKIWDLPGIGSPNFKANQYLKDVKFKTYDFFIILTSERFTENDIMLAKEIKKLKKSFYFVRSKIDNDISSQQRRKGFDEQKVLHAIRENCQKNLKDLGDPRVFLISSFEVENYDFEDLQKTLEEELPDHKRSALLQAWPVCSAESLERKIKMFKGLIWAVSLASGGIAVVPVPGLSAACDTTMIVAFFVRCYFAFGLDEASLTRLSKKVNKPLMKLMSTSKFALAIKEKALVRLQVSGAVIGISTVEYLSSLVPGVGSFAAAGLSFGTTFFLLREGLNDLVKVARKIRKEAALDNLCRSDEMDAVAMPEDSSSETDLSSALQRLGESDLSAAAIKAKEQLDGFENVTLNIAVTGKAGAGKSSFINAFRGLCDEDADAAPTGLTTTTTQATVYVHPTKTNVRLWDLPGIGAPSFNANKYLKEVKFDIYDFFIIIASERFSENDLCLAKEIQKHQKRFYFVRSKIDNDIRSMEQNRNFNEEMLLRSVRKDCYRYLKEAGNPKVFLISSFDLGKYDFLDLVNTLEVELPELKRFALVQSVPVSSPALLEKKKEMLEKLMWLAAVASAAGAFPSLEVLSLVIDKAVLSAFLLCCHYTLGLDGKSLEKLSKISNTPVPKLISAIKSPVALAVASGLSVRPRMTNTKALKSLDDLLDIKLILQGVRNAAEAFQTTHKVLKGALDEMVEDVKEVLKVSGLDE
ncbi:hypothetical protein DNTS_001290 [Danionella cerebrum]|uniref:IRG-type G domain-containing protein n=1 Tax=Danionella cerebrum TaxID=2873325 RepID=A0A553Q3L7_9TELE|nr:hypothetical protein DNTS_001290 [Danionella translucida]